MPIAREGIREILLATLLLGGGATVAMLYFWPAAIPFVVVWIWVLAFFRDPKREREYEPGDLCAPADGTITEISELEGYDGIEGPAVRIGMFLSLFNVHINRSPCAGRVVRAIYKPGEFLDARHPESGQRNESNTLVIEPDYPMPGPITVRQVAGLVARRIICHAKEGDHMDTGHRFGLIKFGSRAELIIPRGQGTEIMVEIGDKVRAGLTLIARQPVETSDGASADESRSAAVV